MEFHKNSLRSIRWLSLFFFAGCNSAMLNDKDPLTPTSITAIDPHSFQSVNDLTRPWGMNALEVQGVSLVVGLNGTGSDPGPTAERAMLLAEMQTRGVERPSEVLKSHGSALAMVRGRIPPGARKGDRFDLEVRVPAGSETTSLHGGWIMQARLKEYARIGNRLSSGHVLAHASGDILTDDFLEGDGDTMFKKRGRVLSGGVVGKERNLGLILRDGFTSVKASAQVGRAINQRFHMFHRGNKEGVAIPKRDNFIELRIHPRYRDNIVRYVRVIQNIAVRESPSELMSRIDVLRAQMSDPTRAAMAAVQLEAIGDAAISVLKESLQNRDPEIRFYAAEGLAYLDESAAAEPLRLAVRDEPAFRWRALTALGSMDDISAHETLIDLLSTESAETRYGAFRILRRLTPDEPVIRGQLVDEKFHFHIVSSSGPPLVHIAKHERPEIVLFGADHPLQEPVVIFAGAEIVIRSNNAGRLTIRKLTAGDDDPELQAELELKDMVRGIVELGGGYPEVVQAISEAKSTGALPSRLEYSALAELGRIYHRDSDAKERSYLANDESDVERSSAEKTGQITGDAPDSNSSAQPSSMGHRPIDFSDPDAEPDFGISDGDGESSDVKFEPITLDRPDRMSKRSPPSSAVNSRDVEFSDLADPAGH